jgi:hypothetical protein
MLLKLTVRYRIFVLKVLPIGWKSLFFMPRCARAHAASTNQKIRIYELILPIHLLNLKTNSTKIQTITKPFQSNGYSITLSFKNNVNLLYDNDYLIAAGHHRITFKDKKVRFNQLDFYYKIGPRRACEWTTINARGNISMHSNNRMLNGWFNETDKRMLP